jgi:hypothetical protein
MEDIELKNIWKEYDRRLEEARVLNLQSWALNLKCFESLQQQKVRSKLRRLAFLKVLTMLLGIGWVGLLGMLIVNTVAKVSPFFTGSLAGILACNLFALVSYVRQLGLIYHINNSESIVDTQLRLAKLQSSTIRVVRVAWLQMPFYTTFYVRMDDILFWLISVPVILLFVAMTVWLYRNVHYRNAGKKWFRLMFNSPSWNYIVDSMEYIKEIEAFKQDLA